MPEGKARRWPGGYWWAVPGIILVMIFLGLFGWAHFAPKPASRPAQVSTESGLYQQYAYIITTTPGVRDKTANFNPAIIADDGVVVAALRKLMETAYDEQVSDDLQPMVEARDDKNYVTFSSNDSKTYFQLFKNSKGEVGSVSFWRDSTDRY